MPAISTDCDNSALTDREILDYLRRGDAATINELIEHAGVTATAIRQRMNRLMKQGLVERRAVTTGRGRPTHQYSLTAEGQRAGGDNYEDLATVLWSEIRAVRDPEVRRGLLGRIVRRLAQNYAQGVDGENLRQRMESLVGLMSERDVPFEVQTSEGGLPVLTALACPYPDLAEQDRSICAMEKMLFSEILGENLQLGDCRLDGGNCCTFETR